MGAHFSSGKPGAAGTLAALQFKPLFAALPDVGLSVETVLAACGLTQALFANPFARFPAEMEHALWAAIEAQSGDPAIGLRLGAVSARRGQHEIEVYLALNAGTLRRALSHVQLILPLLDDRGHLVLTELGSCATISIQRDGGYPRPSGYVDNLFAGSAALYLERIPGFHFQSVDFTRARPRSLTLYTQTFGVTPSFGCDRNCGRFDRAFLDVPVRGADVSLGEILLRHAHDLLQRAPLVDPLVSRVQSVLSEGLALGRTSLTSVARATGNSPRTLRRRLSDMGTSFQGVLDALRRDLAGLYLRDERESVASIASRLGFASSSAFQRAFQRWYGKAPSQYRAEQRKQTQQLSSTPLEN